MLLNNAVFLKGNLAREPRLTKTKSAGVPVLKITLGLTRTVRSRNGKTMSVPDHVDCTMFGPKAAEIAGRLRLGTEVRVVGSLRSSKWDSGGETRYALDVLAEEIDVIAQPAKAKTRRAGAHKPERVESDRIEAAPEPQREEAVPAAMPDPEPKPAPAPEPEVEEDPDFWPFDLDFDFDEEEDDR